MKMRHEKKERVLIVSRTTLTLTIRSSKKEGLYVSYKNRYDLVRILGKSDKIVQESYRIARSMILSPGKCKYVLKPYSLTFQDCCR